MRMTRERDVNVSAFAVFADSLPDVSRCPHRLRGLVRLVGAVGLVAFLTACASPAPVDRPCGVIIDSLKDVQGADANERRRIDVHFERGVAAGCWPR